MQGPAILSAIELFVGLLGVAAIVAIVVRPLRLPYSVALVVVGLLAGLGASIVTPGGPPEVYRRYEEDNQITRGPEGIYTRPSDRPGFGWEFEVT